MIEVRYGFAHGEKQLLHVQRAAEQDRQELSCAARLTRGRFELRQPRRMMGPQLGNPLSGADKGKAVRGQD